MLTVSGQIIYGGGGDGSGVDGEGGGGGFLVCEPISVSRLVLAAQYFHDKF